VAVTFPGLSNIFRAEGVFTRGTLPNSIVVLCAPQDSLRLGYGELTFNDGAGGSFTLPNCLPVLSTLKRISLTGPLASVIGAWAWSLVMLDHRWRWSRVTISGEFNRRNADGSVEESTRATPGAIATLIFEELGEAAYDVSRMPANVYPYVNWRETACDLALAELCHACVCEVCGGEFAQPVIYPSGTGSDMPAGGTALHTAGRTVRPVPSNIGVVGGATKAAARLTLQAVGLESDDSIELIDNLSYKPTGGWGSELPGVFGGITNTTNLKLAQKTIWRWYRVQNASRYQFLNEQVGRDEDQDGADHTLPAQVFGSFYDYSDVPVDTSSGTEWLGGFEFDTDRGIVIFPLPVFAMGSSQVPQPATLQLLAAYYAVGPTNELESLQVSQSLSASGGILDGSTYLHRRPELFDCNDQGFQHTFGTTEANNYLTLLAQKFADNQLDDRAYAGIPSVSLSGLVAQVTVLGSAFGDEGFQTRVCRVEEMNPYGPSEQERRRQSIVRLLADERGL
jgi:hypothetical protein